MKFLLINTCGADGIVAVAEDAAVLATETLPGRSSSENLVPAVRRLMEAQGWRVRDLAAVAVVDGPGSFTGVRVGLSTAKGLCEAGGVGLIAMSRLALVLAAGGAESTGGGLLALLDAGRGDYYYRVSRNGLSEDEMLCRFDDIQSVLAGDDLRGDRVVTCEARVADAFAGVATLLAEPGPEQMLAMARARIAAGEGSDVALADANYLRRTDAELLVEGRV